MASPVVISASLMQFSDKEIRDPKQMSATSQEGSQKNSSCLYKKLNATEEIINFNMEEVRNPLNIRHSPNIDSGIQEGRFFNEKVTPTIRDMFTNGDCKTLGLSESIVCVPDLSRSRVLSLDIKSVNPSDDLSGSSGSPLHFLAQLIPILEWSMPRPDIKKVRGSWLLETSALIPLTLPKVETHLRFWLPLSPLEHVTWCSCFKDFEIRMNLEIKEQAKAKVCIVPTLDWINKSELQLRHAMPPINAPESTPNICLVSECMQSFIKTCVLE